VAGAGEKHAVAPLFTRHSSRLLLRDGAVAGLDLELDLDEDVKPPSSMVQSYGRTVSDRPSPMSKTLKSSRSLNKKSSPRVKSKAIPTTHLSDSESETLKMQLATYRLDTGDTKVTEQSQLAPAMDDMIMATETVSVTSSVPVAIVRATDRRKSMTLSTSRRNSYERDSALSPYQLVETVTSNRAEQPLSVAYDPPTLNQPRMEHTVGTAQNRSVNIERSGQPFAYTESADDPNPVANRVKRLSVQDLDLSSRPPDTPTESIATPLSLSRGHRQSQVTEVNVTLPVVSLRSAVSPITSSAFGYDVPTAPVTSVVRENQVIG